MKNKLVDFHIDRDVVKTHGCRLSFGRQRGVSFGLQWRSWEPDDNGKDPLMLAFSIFVFGTFLGINPHGSGRLARRCASNGINLVHWSLGPGK